MIKNAFCMKRTITYCCLGIHVIVAGCLGPNQFSKWCRDHGGEYQNIAIGLKVCLFKNRTPPINARWTDKGQQDGKIQPKGEDGRPNTGDDEIDCYQGEDPTGPAVPCPPDLLTRTYARASCEEVGGTWTESGHTSLCTSAQWDFLFIWVDGNENDGLEIDEYRCEMKDENGNPSGAEVPCPFDE
jgi:hypothetical protein